MFFPSIYHQLLVCKCKNIDTAFCPGTTSVTWLSVKTVKIEGKDTTLPLEEKDNLRIKKEMANIKVKI